MAGLLRRHSQARRGRRPSAVAAGRRRAGRRAAARRRVRRPRQRPHGREPAGVGDERVLDVGRILGTVVVPGRQRPAPRRQRGRHRRRDVHVWHHGSSQRCRREPRQPVHHRAHARSLARARLPHRLSVRDDERLPLGLWTAPRRPERMVPPAFRPRAVDRSCRTGPAGGVLSRPRHGGADRRVPRLRLGRPLELGRRQRGQRADRDGHAATFRRGARPCRGPLRVRHDGVRCGHRRAGGRRRTAPRLGRPPPPGCRGKDRRRGGRGRGARRGGRGCHRRHTAAAVVPGRSPRNGPNMGRRLAPERRPRPNRRRRPPLDRRAAEGDDHPGRAQRGAGRGGGRTLRTSGRGGGDRGRHPPCGARRGRRRVGGVARTGGSRGTPDLPVGTAGRLQGAAPLYRARRAPRNESGKIVKSQLVRGAEPRSAP